MPKKRSAPDNSQSTSKRRHLAEVNENVINQSQKINLSQNIFLSSQNESIRSGKIARIHLTNFMCHSNFSMDFNNRVNLLVGCNGSGKSAVLTALVIGLGSKARDTNRSSNIKQLIKTGQNSAEIEITIANNGPDAYEVHTYGSLITICRSIYSTGQSSYKIRNESGSLISKKIDEVNKILLYHNIQTDNPVFVLNQDSARTFLKDMEPSKNYQLFLKASQIETIITKLNECLAMYNNYKYQLDFLRKESEFMKNEIEELQEKYERLQSVDNIKIKIKIYKLERLWFDVEQNEEIVSNLNNEIKKLNVESEKYKSLIEQKEDAEKQYQSKIQNVQKELNKLKKVIQQDNNTLKELRESVKNENSEYQKEEYSMKKIQNNINNLKEQVDIINNKITDSNSETRTLSIQRQREQNEAKLLKLNSDESEIQALIEQHKRDFDDLNETKTKFTDEHEELKRQRSNCRVKMDELNREISRMQSSSRNQLSVYGDIIPEFIEEIEKADSKGAFSQKPRGPLGRYIEVENQKWRGPTEYLLQSLLNVFIVDNRKDEAVLDKIKSKFKGFKPTIITMKFHHKVFDVRQGKVKPPNGTILLMDVIKCQDSAVMNCLIDRAKIETVLLCENQDLAIELTSNEDNVPRNLRKLILLHPFLEYFPAPLYRTYSLKPRAPRFIQVNLDEMKKHMESKINHFAQMKDDLEQQLGALGEKLKTIFQQIKHNEIKIEKFQNTKSVIREKVQEIKSIEYPEENQLEFYNEEKKKILEKINGMKNDLDQRKVQLKDILNKKNEVEATFKETLEIINRNEKDNTRMTKKIDDLNMEMNSTLSDAKNWQRKAREADEAITKKKIELTEASVLLNNYTETAQKNGDRIEITHSKETLTELIKKSEYNLKEINKTEESSEEIKCLLEDKQLKFEKNLSFIDILCSTLEMLKKTRLQRFKFIVNLKQHMAMRVRLTFDHVLKVRNFMGEIVIDHKAQKLEVKIVPRDTHINEAVSSTKSLSGGERSYSTIALLLSLWSCVDHPFYFLDEYDVFTDQVNREIMTKLLLTEAERKPHRQYTFLTPQDITFVHATNNITIHKLAEPQR